MPSYISKEGVWEPAQERVVLPDAQKGQEIYEGPDRAATEELKAAGVDHFGQHYSMDSELVMRARQLGFKNVDEYLRMFNYDRAKANEAYEKAKAQVVTHRDPPKVTPIHPETGGTAKLQGFGDHTEALKQA